MKLLREAVNLADGGRGVALATVIRTAGSTPRHPGAKILIGADGSIFGTIGGGRIEQEVVGAGIEVAAGGPVRTVRHHLTRDLAMCCGGSMELYIEPVRPSIAAIEQVLELSARRQSGRLITSLAGDPKRVEQVRDPGREPHCDGQLFIEPIRPSDRLVIFGCGHVARAIGPLAAAVGFDLVVCDDDETGGLDPRPVWADHVVASFDPRDVDADVGPLGLGDYVLIVTRDHAVDQRVLERMLPREELSYLGMIGSRGKVGRFHKRLVAKGVATDASWARLRAPIGLDIGAESPAEIAVSVVAELIAHRNKGRS